MKKFCFLIALCFVIGFFTPCAKAEASTVPQSVIDSAITINYGSDNIVIWQFKNDPNYYTGVELDSNQNYGAPYYDMEWYNRQPWYVAEFNNVYTLVTPAWWHYKVYMYDVETQMWTDLGQVGASSYGVLCTTSEVSTIGELWAKSDRNVVYSKYDIEIRGGSLDGSYFFSVPPVFQMTELAVILEESKPQTNLIRQVIFLVPLSLSLVVSFLGLRKLWNLLRTILYQA